MQRVLRLPEARGQFLADDALADGLLALALPRPLLRPLVLGVLQHDGRVEDPPPADERSTAAARASRRRRARRSAGDRARDRTALEMRFIWKSNSVSTAAQRSRRVASFPATQDQKLHRFIRNTAQSPTHTAVAVHDGEGARGPLVVAGVVAVVVVVVDAEVPPDLPGPHEGQVPHEGVVVQAAHLDLELLRDPPGDERGLDGQLGAGQPRGLHPGDGGGVMKLGGFMIQYAQAGTKALATVDDFGVRYNV